jgi:hypothetical protein
MICIKASATGMPHLVSDHSREWHDELQGRVHQRR